MKTESIQLGKVCNFLNGGTPTRENAAYFEGDIPWITGADITSFLVRKVRSFITEKAVKDSATNLVPAGTVLLVTRTSVGKVAVAGMPLCFSQDITAIRNDEKYLDKGFLIYFLKTKEPYFKQSARGATIGGITREVVSQIEIPLPSLDEQKRIAAILDKADRLRHQRRFAQTLSDSFLQSFFIKMFGDNPKVKLMRLEEVLAESPKNGLYLPAEKYGFGTPIIRINNFYSGTLAEPITFKRVQASQNEIEEFGVKNGEVLVNRVNSIEYLGKCAFVKGIKEKTVYESNMMRLRLRKDLLSAICLVTYLSSEKANLQIQKCAKKAVNQASINQTDVESFIVPVPPFPLQEKFAEIVQKFERVRRQQREATRQAEHLFQTLLHRAFRGKL